MPRTAIVRATALMTAMLALTPTLASAATAAPSPSPSPSAAARCSIPPGMESDAQEQSLQQQCLAQAGQIQTQKDKLSNNLSLAQGSATSLEQLLQQTKQAITDNLAQQDKTRSELHELEMRQADTERQIGATRTRLAARRAAYEDFIRQSYKYQPNLLEYLVSSDGLSDFVGRLAALTQIRNFGNDLIAKIRAEQSRLNDEQDQLRNDHQTALKKQDDLAKAQRDLVDAEVKAAAVLVALNDSIGAAQNELNAADSQSAELVAKIVAEQIARQNELIQQANDAAWAAAQAWLASNNATYVNSTGHSKKYPMIWAAQKGVISQGFGPTDFTMEPPGFGAPHFHTGVDVAAQSGTPIFAADDGVVATAETSMLGNQIVGYGRHVIIAHHNGVMTLYGHLDGYIVKPGDRVTQGQLIGVMGSTGMSTGPHLHFEVRVNNVPTDPSPYLPPFGPNDFKG
ncbi:MAG TPA: peptidoglycan DD-metalloendopeptidase family protein [Candidatus Dormibacteraeota bacterium]|nr:peptidoglycan DD-metalloendopeptidase family protein [Candidatus Dormibacteraeota bacterium]